MNLHGPTSLALLAAVPRQRYIEPHRVQLTERMRAALEDAKGWTDSEACEVAAGPSRPLDGAPSVSAPDGSFWRTSQGTFDWDSTRCSPVLPHWGTTRGGALYALPTPEHPTAGPACSWLLSTPDTGPEAGNGTSNRRRGPSGLGNQAVSLLPTPDTGVSPNGHGAVVRTSLGASTNPRFDVGNTFSDVPLRHQLSLDEPEPPA